MAMMYNAKVDWIGTPNPYIIRWSTEYDTLTSIDFSLAGDERKKEITAIS